MNLLFKTKLAEPNVMSFQKRMIISLKQHKSWIIANTDKNIEPYAVELEQYIVDAMVDLGDESTYEKLTEEEAQAEGHCLFGKCWRWTFTSKARGTITDHEAKYICKHTSANSEDPHGYVYLLYKVHKARSPGKPVPTRPVCLDYASVTYFIRKWVDVRVQLIAKSLQIYLKDSFEFKKLIDNLGRMDHRAKLFTYNAMSMYTNIPTEYALEVISKYVRDKQAKYGHYHAATLIKALGIVMRNKIMKFGDKFRKNSTGTAMGNPPAPAWATLFEGLHKLGFSQDGKTAWYY